MQEGRVASVVKSWRHKLAKYGKVKARRRLKRQAELDDEVSPEYVEKFLAGDTDIYDDIAEHWQECYMEELIETLADEREGEREFFQKQRNYDQRVHQKQLQS